MFCNNCGTYAPDNSAVCPNCGTPLIAGPGAQPNPAPQYQGGYQPAPQMQPQYNAGYQPDEITIDKYASVRNLHDYIFGFTAYTGFIGVIILALMGPNAEKSDYLRFHMNQGLVMALFELLAVIPFIGWIWSIFCVVCKIIAIVYALKGTAKSATFFGKIRIIK